MDIIKTGDNSFRSIAQMDTQISDLDTKIKNITQSKQYRFFGIGTTELTQHVKELKNIAYDITNSDHPEFINLIARIEKALTPILKNANSSTAKRVNAILTSIENTKSGFSQVEVSKNNFGQDYNNIPNYSFDLKVNGRSLALQGAGQRKDGSIVAAGSFGRVFFGKNPTTGEEIAVKVVKKKPHQTMETLKREANFLLQMKDGKNVLGASEVGFQGDYMFVVMKKVNGTELFDKMQDREKPLSLKEKVNVLLDVVKGLKELHRQGIIDKDLKPENILIDSKTNKAIIIDLGLSRTIAEQTKACSGTPTYMAPEVLKGEPPQEASTDTYSFGIILHELLTGKILEDPAPAFKKNHTEKDEKGFKARITKSLTVSQDNYKRVSDNEAIRTKLANLTNSCLKLKPGERAPLPKILTELKDLLKDVSEINLAESFIGKKLGSEESSLIEEVKEADVSKIATNPPIEQYDK